MKLVFAPDSFKDSLSAVEVVEILKKKANEIFPDCEIETIPLADGDKGTIDTLISVLGGKYCKATARDYLGEVIDVNYGVISGDAMIIETTELFRNRESVKCSIKKKVLFSSSYGIGEMILQGLNHGYRKFYIGAGNGVVNDGGMGCMAALGVDFYDEYDMLLEPAGVNLKEIVRIDTSGLDNRIKESEIRVMCSVNNPLLGYDGATYMYGAQNGAGPDELICLEKGMRNYARLIEQETQLNISEVPGTGAAGGLPASLLAFCGAKLRSGISTVLKLIQFENLIDGANLVVVGEGILDGTSIYGKAISGIGMMCKAKGIPVAAIVGGMGKGAEQIYHYGITSVITTVNNLMEDDYAIGNAEELLGQAAERLFRFLIIGMEMQQKENCIPKIKAHQYNPHEKSDKINWAVDPDVD